MTDFKYQTPPPEIAALINSPNPPVFSASPDCEFMATLDPVPYISLKEVAQPGVKLAGLHINIKASAPALAGWNYKRISFFRIKEPSRKTIIALPKGRNRILSFIWSPKGDRVAYACAHSRGVDLVIASPVTGDSRTLVRDRLNCIYGLSFSWMADGEHLVCKLRPDNVRKRFSQNDILGGPAVYESNGGEAPARTYPSVLKSPHDAELLEYFLQSQVALVSSDGDMQPVSSGMMIKDITPSPDGKYFLVSRVEHPFSYSVLINRFPHRYEIWENAGGVIREIGYQPLDEQRPIGHDAVSKGIRKAVWRADSPATVFWVEAADCGDHRVETDIRDRIFRLDAPFVGDPLLFISLGYRFQDIWWTENGKTLVLEEWWKTKRKRFWLVQNDGPENPPKKLYDLSSEDGYGDPGTPLLKRSSYGTLVIATSENGSNLVFSGKGASPDGDRPFLDFLDIRSFSSTRIWRSEPPYHEEPLLYVDGSDSKLLTLRQSGTEPPNLHLRNVSHNTISALTSFPNPYPSLWGIRKELITYSRSDGVKLSAQLYLPPGHNGRKGPLPSLIWAYPREFKNADNAGQIKGSPYEFPLLSWGSPLYWLTQGYAVLAGPSMPIIGEKEDEPNDRYIEQLAMGAQAAVDTIVERGVADPERIAIGGHSYGAFMAVNLLAHTDLFRAGIARNGSYNRTLTPFGFQHEDRDLWKARDTYIQLSPYIWADRIKSPLLILHGADDDNPGTSPMQSEFLYQALKGLGKTVRLVKFPKEGHQYRAKETVMHMAWEISQWLDSYVKKAGD